MTSSTTRESVSDLFDTIITQEHIDQFRNDGYCVVQILTAEQVEEARRDLHRYLRRYGINHKQLAAGDDRKLPKCEQTDNFFAISHCTRCSQRPSQHHLFAIQIGFDDQREDLGRLLAFAGRVFRQRRRARL